MPPSLFVPALFLSAVHSRHLVGTDSFSRPSQNATRSRLPIQAASLASMVNGICRRTFVSRLSFQASSFSTQQRDLAQPFEVSCVASAPTKKKVDGVEGINELIDWLVDNGLTEKQLSLVSIAYFKETGRGLVAKREIEEGEVVVKVPPKLMMTREVALRSPIGKPFKGRPVDDFVLLSLYLLQERSKGPKSFWAPYINILPDEVNCSIFWPESELTTLVPNSPLVGATKNLNADINNAFKQLQDTVFKKDAELFPGSVYNLEQFRWAFSMLLSRSVFLPSTKTLAMIPFADMCNHSADSATFIDFNQDARCVEIVADRDYPSGQQVFVSYGQKTNMELLLGYGFALNDNQHDAMDIVFCLDESDPNYDLKASILKQNSLSTRQIFPVGADKFVAQMWAWLRLVSLDSKADIARYGDEIFELVDQPVANWIERAAIRTFISLLEDLQKTYPSGWEEIKASFNRNFSDSSKYAFILRTGEKKVLKQTLRAARERLVTYAA